MYELELHWEHNRHAWNKKFDFWRINNFEAFAFNRWNFSMKKMCWKLLILSFFIYHKIYLQMKSVNAWNQCLLISVQTSNFNNKSHASIFHCLSQSHHFVSFSFLLLFLFLFCLNEMKWNFISFNFQIFHQYSQEPCNNMSETIPMWKCFVAT